MEKLQYNVHTSCVRQRERYYICDSLKYLKFALYETSSEKLRTPLTMRLAISPWPKNFPNFVSEKRGKSQIMCDAVKSRFFVMDSEINKDSIF